MIFSAADMDPNAVLDYPFDWTDFVGDDSISSYSFPGFPSGITNHAESHAGNVITLWLKDPEEGRSYDITNRITTTGGRVKDWVLRVRATTHKVIPVGPPFASVAEAVAYQPAADGAEPMKVEAVLYDASDLVASVAPEPDEVKTTLTLPMDATQKTATVADPFSLSRSGAWERVPETGVLGIESEILYYSDKSTLNGLQFVRLQRGRLSTIPSTHVSGTEVMEVSYPIRRRRAELYVFEWLWSTRGYIPGFSGVVGSASYGTDRDDILRTVRRIMGLSPGGAAEIRGVVPMTSFRRRRRSPLDFQRG